MTDVPGSAEYYQAHRDDEDEWGDAVEPAPRPRRRLAAMISVRFAPEEADLVRAAAEAEGSSVSDFLRQAALERAAQEPLTVWAFSASLSGFEHRYVDSPLRTTGIVSGGFIPATAGSAERTGDSFG